MLFPIVGVIAFFAYIYLFQVDISGVIATAQKANPLMYSTAIMFGLLEVFFYTVSWYALTNHLAIKMSVKRAFLYVWYGVYVDIIVPAESISGDITRTYLLLRDQCGPCGKIVASLYMHRLLGMVMNGVVVVVGIVLLSIEGQVLPFVLNSIILITATIVAFSILMIVVSTKEAWTLKAIDFVTNLAQKISRGRWKLEKLKEEAKQISGSFHEGMKQFRRNFRPLAYSMLYLALTWIFSLSIPYFVFLSLGNPVSWSVILVTAAITISVKSIPIGVPFEVGIPEAVMSTLYFSLGVPAAISVTATILTRIITLWFRFFIGFGAQQWLELKPIIQNGNGKNKISPQP